MKSQKKCYRFWNSKNQRTSPTANHVLLLIISFFRYLSRRVVDCQLQVTDFRCHGTTYHRSFSSICRIVRITESGQERLFGGPNRGKSHRQYCIEGTAMMWIHSFDTQPPLLCKWGYHSDVDFDWSIKSPKMNQKTSSTKDHHVQSKV